MQILNLGSSLNIQVATGRHCLLSGGWPLELRLQGRAVRMSPWVEICQYGDDDADYLEFETRIGKGWRVQRQIILARKERFLLLCDAVIGSRPTAIDYRTMLPLGADVQLQPEDETTEVHLYAESPLATVIPLSFHEWRQGNPHGSIDAMAKSLVLKQTTKGKGLFICLFFNLHPTSISDPVTWRQLTVAENLEIQSPDTAVGYRLQIGMKQWLVYRSLAPPSNRTVLGQQLTAEFVLGRFTRRGELKTLIEVEPDLE